MAKSSFLTQENIKKNVKTLQAFMEKEKVDGFYFSSSDIFLNEYVPLEDCHRYYLTNFTGSTAEVIVPRKGKVLLFVDGRYFEQADLEVDPSLVQVMKVEMSVGLKNAMINEIVNHQMKTLAVEGDRIDLALLKNFERVTSIKMYNFETMNSMLNYKIISFDKKIHEIDLSLTGESTDSKLKRILKPGEAFFLSSLDSIAWLTNLRRYELPNQSTFRSKALATYDRVYLLMEHIEGDFKNTSVEKYIGSFSKLNDFLTDIVLVDRLVEGKHIELEKVFYSDASINAADFLELKKFFGESKLANIPQGIIPYHANKNEAELNAMRASFDKADKAIFKTINFVKNKIKNGDHFTEMDFYNTCDSFYKDEGAFDQSFKTISGYGPNSSIIHFGAPSAEIKMEANELALLDSGGYFESGYATDTTRTFLTSGKASDRQKEVYTLVLKSLLHAMNVVFPEGSFGSTIDGVTRQPMFKYGYNYNHGTGHGVGINVHEGGFRISPNSTVPLKENTVGSLEPGIYIPGFGGVRLENIVIVKKHPKFNGMLCFESLVYVGFDHELINFDLLDETETAWLNEYEKECAKRGRSFVSKK